MTTGRLEKETKEFAKIEAKLKDLPPVVAEWYYSMRAEEKSYNTVRQYVNVITRFCSYHKINDDDALKNATTGMFNQFMLSLRTTQRNGKEVQTTASHRTKFWLGLNSFYTFLEDNEYIEKNPVPQKSRPKQNDNYDTVALTNEEVNQMAHNIRTNADQRFKNRDLCIFVMGITTGLRSAAILQMNIEDIDFENRKIRVIEKRNKTFDVMIDDTLYQCLLNWLVDRRKYFPKAETDALFLTRFGERLAYDGLRQILFKYSRGINKKVTPHVMRHTCATMTYEMTGDIYLTATQLHHSNVSTTQRYADVSDQKRRDESALREAASLLGGKLKLD